MSELQAWHFVRINGRLQHRPDLIAAPGLLVEAEGPLLLGENGCHASIRALDALMLAPWGEVVERVEVGGEILTSATTLCARWRRTLWVADATSALHKLGLWSVAHIVEHASKAGDELPQPSMDAIAAKRRWLEGVISDEELSRVAERAQYEATVNSDPLTRAATSTASPHAWHAGWVTACELKFAWAEWKTKQAEVERGHWMDNERNRESVRLSAMEEAKELINRKLECLLYALNREEKP